MAIPDIVDFEMRKGNHPNPEFNAIEKQIAEQAFNMVMSSTVYAELGFQRTYNFMHMLRFYMTRDPYLLKLLYKYAPYPEYIEMEMTQGICPLKCKMCELTYWNEKPIHLTLEKFKYAMDQFPNLKWAGNNALGDPFTNPDCWDIWKYLDDKGVVQELYLTGCTTKTEDMWHFTDMKGLVWAKFSVDGATKKTYESIRKYANWDKVWENVKVLDKLKREKGKYFPEIQFHYIIMKDNIDEALDFLDVVKESKVICSNVMFSRLLHNFKEINDVYTEIPAGLPEALIQKGQDLGLKVSLSADITQMSPINECMAWNMPYIFPDGTVISCCCMPKDSYIRGTHKSIHELKIGDIVSNSNGKEQKVTAIFNRKYNGNLYTIKPMGMLPSKFTIEHPIKVIKRPICSCNRKCYQFKGKCEHCNKSLEWNESFLEPNLLDKGDYLIVPRNKVVKELEIPISYDRNSILIHLKVDRDIAYMIGAFVGDGYTTKSNPYEICFSLGKDKVAYDELDLIFNNKDMPFTSKQRGSVNIIETSNKELRDYLREHCGTDCYTKHIDTDIQNIGVELLKDLLQGLIDTDGCYDAKRDQYLITTVSEQLCYDIQEILLKIGISFSVSAKQSFKPILGREVNTALAYQIYFNGKEFNGLEKRQHYWHFDNDNAYIPIKSISVEKVENMDVYNIETEDHTFCTPFIVHNCMNEQNRRDWQRTTSMGNIFQTPMRDIWYGEKYTKLRKSLWEGNYKEAHPVCNICNIYDKNKLATRI